MTDAETKAYALVTGASSGIGYQYVRVLAQRGYHILAVSNEEAMHERAEELRREFPETDIVPLVRDLSQQEAAKELYDYCQEKGLLVEVLINNAGVYHDRDFLDDSPAFTQCIMTLHTLTPVMLAYYFGQAMRSRGKGYILNMSSVTSDYGFQRMSTYSSTKGFLRLFSRSTYIEMKDYGIHVTCVRPGAVATPLYNLNDRMLRLGLAVGAIVTPETLARQGIKALFSGKHEITPGLFTQLLRCIRLLPVWSVRLIRKCKLF